MDIIYFLYLCVLALGVVADFTPLCADCSYVESYIIDGMLFSTECHYVCHASAFRSQTCNCKKGSDWPKRWMEGQHNT